MQVSHKQTVAFTHLLQSAKGVLLVYFSELALKFGRVCITLILDREGHLRSSSRGIL